MAAARPSTASCSCRSFSGLNHADKDSYLIVAHLQLRSEGPGFLPCGCHCSRIISGSCTTSCRAA